MSTTTKPTPSVSRCHRLLQWAAEDLADPIIAANPERLALERQTVINRLSPHIEEIVQLAWAQLQQGQASESSKLSPEPVCDDCHGTGLCRMAYSTEIGPCAACDSRPNSGMGVSCVETCIVKE